MQVDTDVTGGTNYDISGTSQLLSVPYAMYAGSAGGGLGDGSAAGIMPYWNGTTWVTNNTNFYNNGTNIGIGTTSPTSQLDIVDPTMSRSRYRYGNEPSGLTIGNWLSEAYVYNELNTDLVFGTNNIARVRIKNNGNVGIGNNSPTAKLDVAGTIKIADGTQGAGKVLTSDANGLANWATPATTAPYYDINSPEGVPSSAFQLGVWGTMVDFVFYNNCTVDRIFAGTMLISATGAVKIISYQALDNGTMTASGNVISLVNGCGTITVTLNVSGSNCTITSGGPSGIFVQAKLTTIGI